MVFNSSTFFFFFILFYLVFWLINSRFPTSWRNLFIILASYIFYGFWDWRFLGLIVLSSSTDYLVGLGISSSKSRNTARLLLGISIVVNLGILATFKYYDFFIRSLNEAASLFSIKLRMSSLHLILPVGISFYTFQTLGYSIDVYRGKIKATKDLPSFFAFVSFFPQLVAGPIERAGRLLPQFSEKKVFDYQHSVLGLRLAFWGFFKKIVIADNFGALADLAFGNDQGATALLTLAGSLFFALQIYCDFSGYSDIAIGISRMLGFNLMKNFNSPYFSASLREFWQRWHISLSSWFRDYLYIPLGGNRKGKVRTQLNVMVTFILSGLWHGANITFLIWGAIHGVLLLLGKAMKTGIPRRLRVLGVFILVTLCWIPFRAADTTHMTEMFRSLLDIHAYAIAPLGSLIGGFGWNRFLALAVAAILFLYAESLFGDRDFSQWLAPMKRPVRWMVYYMAGALILILGNFDVKPYFIYFQF